MAVFKIHAEKSILDTKTFLYDNETNTLSDESGFIYESQQSSSCSGGCSTKSVVPFSKDVPLTKSSKVRILKIQLGLSCNYACDYCSQKFVERPKETTPKDIENFMAMLDSLQFIESDGLKVEFWGGEPLVYWKTMKPLAEALMERFSSWQNKPQFSVITNGSILTEEICAWLYAMGFAVSISHDGPGQSVRGPDPFEDPKVKETVIDFYNVMKPLNRISFNAMLNNKNMSRKAIHNYFIELTGDEAVPLGEGGVVDAYDDDGVNNSLNTKQDHFNFRRTAFNDIHANDGNIGFGTILQKIDGFTNSLLTHQDAKYLGQKCGMDKEDVIAIDLRGNVITCQNVSAVETAKNGESHLGGHITSMNDVQIKTATHWKNRKDCASCPVLHVCQGSCMYLQDKYWETSCDNSYSDAVVLFALSIKMITGYIPVTIEADHLPLDRQDIWGTVYEHKEDSKKKTIPITPAKPDKIVYDAIEVYAKSQTY
jgi:uncharacterized protein